MCAREPQNIPLVMAWALHPEITGDGGTPGNWCFMLPDHSGGGKVRPDWMRNRTRLRLVIYVKAEDPQPGWIFAGGGGCGSTAVNLVHPISAIRGLCRPGPTWQ
jgi:hypothetical protein